MNAPHKPSHAAVRRTALIAVGAMAACAGASASASAATGPAQPGFATAFALSQAQPDLGPPGANDFGCHPSAAHPRPVVLVHGTFENRYDNWAYIAPRLKAAGYCVFALDYGDEDDSFAGRSPAIKGTGDIRSSAKELASFVDRVRRATGAAQVDLVGHSQGGLLARVYLKYEGGADRARPERNAVRRVISLGATNHGTTLSGIATLAAELRLLGAGRIGLGPAAIQQTKTSNFTRQVNAGGETFPGIGYTVIGTRYDEVSTPYQDTFLTAGPGASVHNVRLQDGCEVDLSDHLALSYGPRALGYVLQALDPSRAPAPPCAVTTPVFTLDGLLPTTPPGTDPTPPSAPIGTTPTTSAPPATTAPTTSIPVLKDLRVPGVDLSKVRVPLPQLAG